MYCKRKSLLVLLLLAARWRHMLSPHAVRIKVATALGKALQARSVDGVTGRIKRIIVNNN